tara:strand:+ start:197 stop:478 length:282 start_codon:yes stop_codon:yes gene_type:complete
MKYLEELQLPSEEAREIAEYILSNERIEDRMREFEIDPESESADAEWEKIEAWAIEVQQAIEEEIRAAKDLRLGFEIDQYLASKENHSPLVWP